MKRNKTKIFLSLAKSLDEELEKLEDYAIYERPMLWESAGITKEDIESVGDLVEGRRRLEKNIEYLSRKIHAIAKREIKEVKGTQEKFLKEEV
jgi:hypothetical protein